MPDSSPAVLRRPEMSAETVFRIQLVLGYVAWLLCFSVYIWPRLKTMDRYDARVQSLHCTAFDSSGSSSSFRASWGVICPVDSLRSPRMVTSPPECWQCLRFSPQGYARCFGFSSSPSILWGQPTS